MYNRYKKKICNIFISTTAYNATIIYFPELKKKERKKGKF
jgi:hypothetical protein